MGEETSASQHKVLVPPLFDFPPLAARNRMVDSSYNLLFGKLALKSLLHDYFDQPHHFTTRLMLKPIDDPHVDLIATVSAPLDHKPDDDDLQASAFFRWQSEVHDPNTFMDLYVSNSDPTILRLRSCAFYPKLGLGAFGIFRKRLGCDDYGVMGLRYASECLSIGATVMPLALKQDELPTSAWIVSKFGRLSLGVQYDPQFGGGESEMNGGKLQNLKDWSVALGYGAGSPSPLTPSFNFSFELAGGSLFTSSFYQRLVFQRQVMNPNQTLEITNYVDLGFEMRTRVDEDKTRKDGVQSTFDVVASWQANKHILLKAKMGSLTSSIALAFKSWWNPSFTFNVSASKDRMSGKTGYGFGISMDSLGQPSYQRANQDMIMRMPSGKPLVDDLL